MAGKKFFINRPLTPAILSALALCLLLYTVVQCGLCTKQNSELTTENEALSAALTESKQAIDETPQNEVPLPKRLSEATSVEEHKTGTGFFKKDDIYLLDDEEQLWTLRRIIAENSEIEPGVPANTASYRLRQDIYICPHPGYEKLFCLGTQKTPFGGSFDGDGHVLSGYFPMAHGADVPEALFHMSPAAKVKNLSVTNLADQLSKTGIHPTISEQWQLVELETHLPDLPGCRVQAEIYTWDLSIIQQTSDVLHSYWEKNAKQDHAAVSMTFRLDALETESSTVMDSRLQDIQTSLCTLAGTEYAEMIEETAVQETGCLWFIRLEQIEGLTCCTFEVSEPYYHPHNCRNNVCNYYIITEGQWEGADVSLQSLAIPYTDSEMSSIGVGDNYRLEAVDFNFDGKRDLLIHEGYSGGTGGSWDNYRAMVWNDAAGQFERFSSFPAQVYKLEFDRQRIVNRLRVGAGEEYVFLYEIVNGEYVCTKYLLTEESWNSEDDTVITLYYYEMGELVETHVLSDIDERKNLYPDMDYWPGRV